MQLHSPLIPSLKNLNFFSLFSKLKWQKRSIVERGAVAINIPLMCLVLSLGTHVFLRQLTLLSEARVEHLQETLQESRSLLIDMLNTETAVRGYYITRQSVFLEPYRYGVKKLPKTFGHIKQLVANDPAQTQRVERLEGLSQQKLNILQDRIGKVQRGELIISTTGSNLSLLEGKQAMDRFRQVLTEFTEIEQQALNLRYADLQQFRDLNILVIVLGVAISGLGGAFAAKLFTNLAAELNDRQSELKESTNLVRAIFNNIIDGVITLDANGQIEECNDAALKMFGYQSQQLSGQNWTILLGKNSRNITSLAGASKVQIAEMGHLWQTQGQHSGGNYFPIEISISTIDLAADERQIAIVRDISQRQQAEDKLQSRTEELIQLNSILRRTNTTLKERNRELDRFAYVTSHDLKAPLRAIANLSNWIAEDLEGTLPPENQNQLRLLRGRVDRMEGLINGLLEYSRIGRRQIPVEYTDVALLIGEILTKLSPPATFTVVVAPELPKFNTRRVLLRQVFFSLIENAIEHHPSSCGRIELKWVDLGDRYEFAVSDDGQGIESQYHERIYSIFQTLKARDTHESTGIGLAIVKKIVETEGGTIELQSSLGQGATFRFTWCKYPIESLYTEGE